MDNFFKAVAAVLITVVICLILAKQSKDMAVLVSILACCMIAVLAMQLLAPVIDFFDSLEDMIQLDSDLLQILLKVVGIGMIGELASMICSDAGNAALGKALQFLSSILVLWLSLPLLQSLLELIGGILEVL